MEPRNENKTRNGWVRCRKPLHSAVVFNSTESCAKKEKIIAHENNIENWEATFESWYYNWLLAISESEFKGLPKSDDKINDLLESKEQLKANQIKSIISSWTEKQIESEKRLKRSHGSVKSLYNQKGPPGQKRNSLRKIINTDFQFLNKSIFK